MGNLGNDVMALACILASAAVGGVVTVAALDRDRGAEVVHVRAVVVDVDRDVRILLDEARARMEEARARAEVMRALSDEALRRDLERDVQRLQRELARLEEETGR